MSDMPAPNQKGFNGEAGWLTVAKEDDGSLWVPLAEANERIQGLSMDFLPMLMATMTKTQKAEFFRKVVMQDWQLGEIAGFAHDLLTEIERVGWKNG